MAAYVMCRICQQKFDREKLIEGIDWVRPSRNWYFHKKCYDNWIVNKNDVQAQITDEEFIPFIYEFFGKDLKVEYDYVKCESQRKNFIKNKGYNNKGIYFALKYYYEILGNDWDKAKGGIGIVPYVYNDSREYWQKRVMRDADIIDRIIKQMQERQKREKLVIEKKKSPKQKPVMHWAEIEASADE